MGIQDAIAGLSALLGHRLTRSKSDLDLHGRSESHFHDAPPDAVAYPETTREVAEIIRICVAEECPVVGWGVGTSLEGQAQAFRGGVSVDFSRMNRVIEVNQEDMDVRLQPGVTREALNEELRATGLFFPIDPGANATLGGMASTRASGTTAVRYGTMRENVLGLEVVTAEGRIIRTGTRARKSSSGYDLTSLFVGAEGTLGLITELTLRLHGQPEAVASAVCAFPSVQDAVTTVIETIQMGLPVARIELMDRASIEAVNAFSGTNLPVMPHLLLEFHGSESGVRETSETFGDIAQEHGGTGFDRATHPEERTALWTMRHNAFYAILALRPGARAVVTDICVPVSRLAEAIEGTRADLEEAGVQGPILGHVGDGNFHAVLLLDEHDEDEMARARHVADQMVARALALGGTATGEHGIGVGKQRFMEAEHGDAWQLMGVLKQALDPGDILNPGKLVPPRN